MSEAHVAIAHDLKMHFRTVGIQVWGCRRRTSAAVDCYTEFHRHHPAAVCVAHFDLARRARGLVLLFRDVQPLFGSPCRRASHGVKPHHHLLKSHK